MIIVDGDQGKGIKSALEGRRQKMQPHYERVRGILDSTLLYTSRWLRKCLVYRFIMYVSLMEIKLKLK